MFDDESRAAIVAHVGNTVLRDSNRMINEVIEQIQYNKLHVQEQKEEAITKLSIVAGILGDVTKES